MSDYQSGPIEGPRGYVHGFRMRDHFHKVWAIEATNVPEMGHVMIQLHSQRSRNNGGRGGTIMILTQPELQHLMLALRRVMEKPPMLVEL